MDKKTIEINIDALVGPTHHYSGMGVGNVASMEHRHRPSSPKRAAMEGLKKSWLVAQTGTPQFLLPPLKRPRLDLLARYGFSGTSLQQLESACRQDISLVSSVYSSSFMWAANAATVTAASDSFDGMMHMTIANLSSSLHRTIEAEERHRQFSQFFQDLSEYVTVHPALPGNVPLRDEGAANHMRLSSTNLSAGINVFVHGDSPGDDNPPMRFFPRHTLAASRMIQRHHRLNPDHTFYLQQHPSAISSGVFHNDVIATSHQNLLIHHEMAFTEEAITKIAILEDAFQDLTDSPLYRIVVQDSELNLQDAVRSYLFNSQLVSPSQTPAIDGLATHRSNLPPGQLPRMLMIAPQQCREVPAAEQLINRWIDDSKNPIDQVVYVELRQSMAGGGGPACLRLRLPIDRQWIDKLPEACRLDHMLYDRLMDTFDRYYPERLTIGELADYQLAEQSWVAGQVVSKVLGFAE